MSSMARRYFLLLAGLAVACALATGCNLSQPYPEKEFYALELGKPQAGAQAPVASSAVRVQRVRMAKPYDGTTFIYRVGPSKLEADYYNGFIAAPDGILTGELARWLSAARVFPAVVEPGGQADYGYSLETSVQGLYADYTNRKAPKAVIRMRVYLLQDDPAGSYVVFAKDYEESEPMTSDSPAVLVAGWEQAYRRLLTSLAADLRASVSAAGATGSEHGQD